MGPKHQVEYYPENEETDDYLDRDEYRDEYIFGEQHDYSTEDDRDYYSIRPE